MTTVPVDLAGVWWDPAGALAPLTWLAPARAALVPPAARAGSVLLDVGCGGGLLAPHVAGLGHLHVGVDLPGPGVGAARAHGVTVVAGDATALPLPDASADVVCAGQVLEHVEVLSAAIEELCRVLRPGGCLVIDTLADTAAARLLALRVGERTRPGLRGFHRPDLLVEADLLVAECARHGVALEVAGWRPSAATLGRWLWGALRPPAVSGAGVVVATRWPGVLYRATGTKVAG